MVSPRMDGVVVTGLPNAGARGVAGENVAIEIVDDAGIFLHLERPDLVGERILEFLG